jgi:hypothetical protein
MSALKGDERMNEKLYVRNSSDKSLKLYVEPWGDETVLQPGEGCHIRYCLGPEERDIEVEIHKDAISLHFGFLAELV